MNEKTQIFTFIAAQSAFAITNATIGDISQTLAVCAQVGGILTTLLNVAFLYKKLTNKTNDSTRKD